MTARIKKQFLFLLLFPFVGVCSNTTKIDSLKRAIAVSPLDSNVVNLYVAPCRQYEYFKSKERIENFITALEISQYIRRQSTEKYIDRKLKELKEK